jgi:hypothetical protein
MGRSHGYNIPQTSPMPTRRSFLSAAVQSALLLAVRAQTSGPTLLTRPDVAVIDRERILAAAAHALNRASEQNSTRVGFLHLTLDLPALAAAVLLDPAKATLYNAQAARLLQAAFVDPATRLSATPAFTSIEPITDRAALAEIAVAIPFFASDAALLAACRDWFTAYLNYLLNNRTALLARDAPDHNGGAWLLQAAAAARLDASGPGGNDQTLTELRHRFRTPTLRAQISPAGFFQNELPTPNPYRNSLFNLDMMAGACILLSTRFESVWNFELPDGPGMRSAVARHAPYIADRNTWPLPADETHFHQLPCRRPALVLAARAFQQPEYATLWRSLQPAQPDDPDLLYAFPIRQPLLWLRQTLLLG